MGVLQAVWLFVRGFSAGGAALIAENLALREQLIVLQRSIKRPKLRTQDRIFWSWLSRIRKGWRSALVIVQPGTVIRTTEKVYLAVRDEDIARAQQVQAELLGEVTGPNLTDAKVTQTAQKRHFPGRQGCRPKEKVPD